MKLNHIIVEQEPTAIYTTINDGLHGYKSHLANYTGILTLYGYKCAHLLLD